MAQLSRPYQIGLAVVALLGLVWVVALRGHGASEPSSPSAPAARSASPAGGSSTPSSASPPPSGASSAAAEAKAAGTPTHIYHGPAPGLEGLTRDIAKAHEAVGTSQREAKRFENESAQGSGADPSGAAGSSASSASASTSTSASSHAAAPARTVSTATPTKPSPKASASHPAQQLAVEGALARHKTVLLLFWNAKSSVDVRVRQEVDGVARGSKGRVVAFDAQPNQVGLFGAVTEVTHVYETPTILIVSAHGLVSTITGLTDGFALEQAVREAQQAK